MSAHANRKEDHRLITGAGCYAADWNLPRQLHAAFVRSDRAHARIVSVDVAAARAAPGVAAVLTGEDAVRAGMTRWPNFVNFPGKGGSQVIVPERPVLAHGRVRFVGDLVALVVAESALAAQDAAGMVAVEYEDLPVVVRPADALVPGAPQLHESVPGTLPFVYEAGDEQAVAAAIAGAAHVTRLKGESTSCSSRQVAATRRAPATTSPRARATRRENPVLSRCEAPNAPAPRFLRSFFPWGFY